MSTFFVATDSMRDALGWTMLHLIWVGTVIGIVAAIARRVLRTVHPEVRYRAAVCAMILMAVAPPLLFLRLHEPKIAVEPVSAVVIQGGSFPSETRIPRSSPPRWVTTTSQDFVSRSSRLESWVPYLPWIWLMGSTATLMMLVAGLFGVERLRRSSRILQSRVAGDAIPHDLGHPREDQIMERCHALAASLGIARRVAVGVCDRLISPVLIGVARPLILLPAAALGGWSVPQVEMVLLHELAHLKRRDNLVNLLQRLVESLVFFHPTTWWVSRWIRLERELCCDRLVVDRVGEPRKYAELLVLISGHGRPKPHRQAATAMADGPMTTRIRRILNLEDRSMHMSLTEGLGVAGTLAMMAALAVGSQPTDSPAPKPQAAKLAMLKKAVERTKAALDPVGPHNYQTDALLSLAHAQLKLGDRDSARATISLAFDAIERSQKAANDSEVKRTAAFAVGEDGKRKAISEAEIRHIALMEFTAVPTIQREAGDLEGARASLDRLTRLVDARTVKSDKPSTVVPLPGDPKGLMMVQETSDSMGQLELLAGLATERCELGDKTESLALTHRAIALIGLTKNEPPAVKMMLLGYFASLLHKTGDLDGARDLVAQMKTSIEAMKTDKQKDAALDTLAVTLAMTGDLDGALAIAENIKMPRLLTAFDNIIATIAKPDFLNRRTVFFDPGGLVFDIGADGLKIVDPATAKRDLAKIAKAIKRLGHPQTHVALISKVAHLQAKAGDIKAACETAMIDSKLTRGKGEPGATPSPFAILLCTQALISRESAEAKHKFLGFDLVHLERQLPAMCPDPRDAVYVKIFFAREQTRLGEKASALGMLKEAETLAQTLAEPRRSRSLAMIADGQAKAGDLAAAEITTDLIRAYPLPEKLKALQMLVSAHEDAGNVDTAKAFARKALALLEAKPPADAKVDDAKAITDYPRMGYDSDAEFSAAFVEKMTKNAAFSLVVLLDGTDAAIRKIRETPAAKPSQIPNFSDGMPYGAQNSLIGILVKRGDFDGIERVLDTIDQPAARMQALEMMAQSMTINLPN